MTIRTPLGYRSRNAKLAVVARGAIAHDDTAERLAIVKRRALAHLLMQWLYRSVWLLNLAGTIIVAVLVGQQLSLAFGLKLSRIDYAVLAVAWQLFSTFIEQHLWKTGKTYLGPYRDRVRQFWQDLDRVDVAMIVFVGVLDALPAAWLIWQVLIDISGIPVLLPYLIATVISVAMAMLTEPAIDKHRKRAKRLLAEAGYNTRWL